MLRRPSTRFLRDSPIMAVAATIGTLTEELVATVAKLDTKASRPSGGTKDIV